jgi:hypothetical protein
VEAPTSYLITTGELWLTSALATTKKTAASRRRSTPHRHRITASETRAGRRPTGQAQPGRLPPRRTEICRATRGSPAAAAFATEEAGHATRKRRKRKRGETRGRRCVSCSCEASSEPNGKEKPSPAVKPTGKLKTRINSKPADYKFGADRIHQISANFDKICPVC